MHTHKHTSTPETFLSFPYPVSILIYISTQPSVSLYTPHTHMHTPSSLSVFSFRWGMERGLIRRQRFFVFQPLQNVKNVWLSAEYKAGGRGAGSERVRRHYEPKQERERMGMMIQVKPHLTTEQRTLV